MDDWAVEDLVGRALADQAGRAGRAGRGVASPGLLQVEGGHLVDRGLPGPGREHGQHIVPRHHLLHGLELLRAQLRPAKPLLGDPLQLRARVLPHGGGRYPDTRAGKRRPHR